MSKITSERLSRQAVVYIRQSTADQVANNLESKRRQYGLADRAQQLGWNDVAIIDDDLGRSGGGVARPGFEKLLAAICDGRVGQFYSSGGRRQTYLSSARRRDPHATLAAACQRYRLATRSRYDRPGRR
jgi:hypothetical protein